MTYRVITNVRCPCGHHGTIIESRCDDPDTYWHLTTLRGLTHDGTYDGLDPLFSDTTPACACCGISLEPGHVVAPEFAHDVITASVDLDL